MARIDPPSKPGVLQGIVEWLARRRLGKPVEPLGLKGHQPWLLVGYSAFEFTLDRQTELDAKLKELAGIKAATLVGCRF